MDNLIDQLYDLELEQAYFVYIKFCYKIIPLLNNINSEYIVESIQKAKSFWFDSKSNIDEKEIINRRVKILKYMEEKDIDFNINSEPELKFSIIPLWTKPPSEDIGDSLDWAFTLLKVINIPDDIVKTKLYEALNDIP
ncbi:MULTISPECIES: hypothetical protein [Acinetobacter calcoaceticus/baumannii complex]|uniref:hypothetical protein n=1 Tax=Acinetobacter calcoaceticus/baumannii complex TaxID=909768 RepID=UPI0002D0B178|nr:MULTISPECIES: hypothetical protein [Acinetobacter calcoaceticus/baumannii complex]EKV4527329.1 hypothetical protein [Acinetobacter baumannii]ENU47230.1 hypothetical protein F984_01599 [Acinetobacter nosocomialis NIPH 2119]KQF19413.1 hypothetical protein APC04_09645 [Acinetobacter baumannii]MBJ9483028.1 hypothetical protein [Acinetobacter baumannii]MBJ9911656.1 hypothetical protein [Acinetobacter baumannii]